MKKSLLLLFVFLLIATSAFSAVPYIGLYTDPARTGACVVGVVPYQVDYYIMFLPNEHGMACAQFGIEYPAVVTDGNITYNGMVCTVEGGLWTGIKICVCECYGYYQGWNWLLYQTLYVFDPTPTWMTIIKHLDPSVDCIQFIGCGPEYPWEYCVKPITMFGINQLCPPANPVGAEKASWGAIKSIMAE